MLQDLVNQTVTVTYHVKVTYLVGNVARDSFKKKIITGKLLSCVPEGELVIRTDSGKVHTLQTKSVTHYFSIL